jgi:ribosomal protein S27AE
MRWLLGLAAILAVAAFVLLGGEDPEDRRTCPGCGLEAVMPVHRGAAGGPGRLRCTRCGAEWRARGDGSLRPV